MFIRCETHDVNPRPIWTLAAPMLASTPARDIDALSKSRSLATGLASLLSRNRSAVALASNSVATSILRSSHAVAAA